MTWRALTTVLLGLLLTVPLVALFVSSSWPKPLASPELEQRNVAPMLSQEQRRQLSTWRQPCRRSDDCDSPLVCFADVNMRGLYCTDSDCVTDAQCRDDFVCGLVSTLNGEVLKRCLLVGDRREGESCVRFSKKYAEACARGLLCDGWCGRPCEPEVPGSCPEGFFCPREGGPEGPSCLPSCEARGCPPGQACIRFGQGASVCSVVRGTNCQQLPCPEAQVCQTHTLPRRAGVVWMRCELPCSNDGLSCPEGSVCRFQRCVRACGPDSPGTCGPGEKCARSRDGARQVCVFDDEA